MLFCSNRSCTVSGGSAIE
ncbi:MAG TPA: hypothetical protein ENN81_00060 [Phycisphaerales bacterium]|nr:hypothetical protein [Phycisphaerales bacterium]